MIWVNLPTCISFIFLLSALVLSETSSSHADGYECFVNVQSDVTECYVQGNNQVCHYIGPLSGGRHSIPNGCMRSNIFGGDGYLAAYPSTGGVVFLKDPSAVDLQHLGLPHTYDTERSRDEDDALAARMVQFGAQWWPNWSLYFKHDGRMEDARIFYDYHMPPDVHVAVPTTGGAWVANFTRDVFRYGDEDAACQPWLPPRPLLWRMKMRYTLTMDDKCEVMKDMGATFHDTLGEVPGIAKTVEDARNLFEPFRERLQKMEDDKYRRRFCTNHVYEDESEDEETADEKPRWGIWPLFN